MISLKAIQRRPKKRSLVVAAASVGRGRACGDRGNEALRALQRSRGVYLLPLPTFVAALFPLLLCFWITLITDHAEERLRLSALNFSSGELSVGPRYRRALFKRLLFIRDLERPF